MNSTYDDCCLLSNICLNSERIFYLFECRFKSNSNRTSFDFKSFLPEQPSNNTKISESLLEFSSIKINLRNNNDENISSESSEDEIEDILSPKLPINTVDDDYLNGLAEWEPNKRQLIVENDDEEEEEEMKNDIQQINNENTHSVPMDLSTEIPTTQAEDILITFIHRPVKSEPITYDDTILTLSQLDGQTDFLFNNNSGQENPNNENKNLNKINTEIKSDETIHIDNISSQVTTSQINHNNKMKSNKRSNNKNISPLLSSAKKINEKINLAFVRQNPILSKNPTINENIPSQYTHDHQCSKFIVNNSRKTTINDSKSIKIQKTSFSMNTSKLSKSLDSTDEKDTKIKKRLDKELNHPLRIKKRSSFKRRKLLPIGHNCQSIRDFFPVIKRSSKNDNIQYSPMIRQQIDQTRQRSENYFDDCIIIDDDDVEHNDIKETEQQSYSISTNIHTREKLLDHAVDSSSMRIKWLLNLELLLLEHISICHQENIRPLNKFYSNSLIQSKYFNNISSYYINPSFISIIILNFLKIFIIRNCNSNQNELTFFQFSLTSYLRYLFIELPTYNHQNFNNDDTCIECYQYSLIISNLFDLLFDLIEYDICEIHTKEKYNSLLIENDYFNQLNISKKQISFNRIKLIIYFIELIQIHRNKCQNIKQERFSMNENKYFQLIEDFIQYIIYQINNLNNQKISICFNVMELCILFANEKENRVKQMALFLTKLCEDNVRYLHLFLFNENLLCDIRLLLINELIGKKVNIKLISMDCIETFFHLVENALTPANPIDDMLLLLIRSLFNTYADLIINIKHSIVIKQLTSLLRNKLESIYIILRNLSYDSNYFQRTEIFFRLLKYKWNKL